MITSFSKDFPNSFLPIIDTFPQKINGVLTSANGCEAILPFLTLAKGHYGTGLAHTSPWWYD